MIKSIYFKGTLHLFSLSFVSLETQSYFWMVMVYSTYFPSSTLLQYTRSRGGVRSEGWSWVGVWVGLGIRGWSWVGLKSIETLAPPYFRGWDPLTLQAYYRSVGGSSLAETESIYQPSSPALRRSHIPHPRPARLDILWEMNFN